MLSEVILRYYLSEANSGNSLCIYLYALGIISSESDTNRAIQPLHVSFSCVHLLLELQTHGYFQVQETIFSTYRIHSYNIIVYC